MKNLFCFLLLVSSFCAAPAFATAYNSDTTKTQNLTQPLPSGYAGSAGTEKKWSGMLGVGVVSAPEYKGASDNEIKFLPLIDIEYKQRYFLSTYRGLGMYFFRDNRFALAVMANMDWGRDEGDNARLRGLGDLDPTAQLGAELKWDINNWLSFDADVYQAISPGGHEGAYGNLGFGMRRPLSKNFSFRADTSVRWASDSYMSHVFGVNAGQSARSGLRQFNAESGLMSWQIGGALDFMMGRGWIVSPTVRYTQLMADAADSPITQDKGQFFGGLFLGYRF
jgi:outer membrane protein